jgi:hypothetical protein
MCFSIDYPCLHSVAHSRSTACPPSVPCVPNPDPPLRLFRARPLHYFLYPLPVARTLCLIRTIDCALCSRHNPPPLVLLYHAMVYWQPIPPTLCFSIDYPCLHSVAHSRSTACQPSVPCVLNLSWLPPPFHARPLHFLSHLLPVARTLGRFLC